MSPYFTMPFIEILSINQSEKNVNYGNQICGHHNAKLVSSGIGLKNNRPKEKEVFLANFT